MPILHKQIYWSRQTIQQGQIPYSLWTNQVGYISMHPASSSRERARKISSLTVAIVILNTPTIPDWLGYTTNCGRANTISINQSASDCNWVVATVPSQPSPTVRVTYMPCINSLRVGYSCIDIAPLTSTIPITRFAIMPESNYVITETVLLTGH